MGAVLRPAHSSGSRDRRWHPPGGRHQPGSPCGCTHVHHATFFRAARCFQTQKCVLPTAAFAGQLACCGDRGMFAGCKCCWARGLLLRRRRRLRGEAPTTSWPAWARGCSAAPARSPARRLACLLTRLPPGLHPPAPCLLLTPAAVALLKGEVDVPPMPHPTPPLQVMAVALAG